DRGGGKMSDEVARCTPATLQAVLQHASEEALSPLLQLRCEAEVVRSGRTRSGVRHIAHASSLGGFQNQELCPPWCMIAIAAFTRFVVAPGSLIALRSSLFALCSAFRFSLFSAPPRDLVAHRTTMGAKGLPPGLLADYSPLLMFGDVRRCSAM